MEFCFPEAAESSSSASESFTFTLTQDEGTRVFGFCRRLVQNAQPVSANPTVCLCVLSQRPWFSLFMHMLDILQLNYDLGRFVPAFVSAAYAAPLPASGSLRIEPLVRGESFYGSFRLSPPVEDRPTGVQFEALLNALGVANTLRLLGALLTEQRVVFVGARWGHVSGCAHAATVLLYPLQWQHIFIPVLPHSKALLRACAPMPFVLGVASRHLAELRREPIEQVLFVDVDAGKLSGDDEALRRLHSPRRFESLRTQYSPSWSNRPRPAGWIMAPSLRRCCRRWCASSARTAATYGREAAGMEGLIPTSTRRPSSVTRHWPRSHFCARCALLSSSRSGSDGTRR